MIKKSIVVSLWVFFLGIAVPSCGKKVDKLCVRGKARIHQNIATWGYPGEMMLRPGDRLIARECSELMRTLTFRDQYDVLRDNGYIPDWM